MFSFRFGDVGFNCAYKVKETQKEEIIKKVMEQGKNDHNLQEKDFTPSLLNTIKEKIQTVE